MILAQELLDFRALNLPKRGIERRLLGRVQIVIERPPVAQRHRCVQQVADVIGAAPDLRHAAVHIKQRIDCLHAGADRILRGEDRVSRRLCKLPEEGKILRACRHNIRSVPCLTRHKECGDIRHHDRNSAAAVLRQLLDLVLRHAQMIQPLLADLLACALPHGLLHIIALAVGEQRIHPDEALILRLALKLRLPVDRPAHEPGGILHRDNAAGHNASGERVAVADILDVRNDLLIQCGDRRAHPVGLLRVIAKFLRMPERRVLRRDLLPHVPAAALADRGIERCRLILRTDRGIFHTAAVRDEHQIILRQRDRVLLPVPGDLDRRRELALRRDVELHVVDLDAVLERHVESLQIPDHRQNHRLILIVFCEAERGEIRQTADVMHISLQVPLHLQRAVPVLKGKHGAPVQPEIGLENLIVENLVDALVIKLLIRGQIQLHDLHAALVRQTELLVCVRVLPAVLRRAAQRIVRIPLVQPVIFIQYADALRLDGRNGAEQIPHAFKVIVHLPAAAHNIADIGHILSVTGTSRDLVLLQNMNMTSRHLRIPHEIAGSGQRCKSRADDICRFLFHALRFFRAGKCFIIAAGIIHTFTSVPRSLRQLLMKRAYHIYDRWSVK